MNTPLAPTRRRSAGWLVALALLGLTLPACRFTRLNSELGALDAAARIGGTVDVDAPNDTPVLVAALRFPTSPGHPVEVLQTVYLRDTREYEFSLEPGRYEIIAFEDRNANQRVDAGERGAYLGPFDLAARERSSSKHLHIVGPFPKPPPEAEDKRLIVTGLVMDLEDERFSAKVGTLGVWQPMTMLQQYKPGLYLLEPYSDTKTPVVFVHGMGGYAQEFRELIASLDRERFQPWVLMYPSGLRLERTAVFLHQALEGIRQSHPFERACLVAHSMGGLVARRALDHHLKAHPEPYVRALVSIASPLGGFASAESGVDMSPVVVPAWRDLVPDSEFAKALYATPLPKSLEYYLLAAFQAEGADDGVVDIQSQLLEAAQNEATVVRAYITTHTGALKDERVIRQVKIALDRCRLDPPRSGDDDDRRSSAPSAATRP